MLHQAAKEHNNKEIRTQPKKIGSVYLTHRELSAKESCYHVLGLPLRRSSKVCIFINCNAPENRAARLLSKSQLDSMQDDDENIFATNSIDRYSAIPDQLEDISLVEFIAGYVTCHQTAGRHTYSPEQTADDDDEPRCDSDVYDVCNIEDITGKQSILTLKRNLGYIGPRREDCKVRWSSFKEDHDSELYYRLRLMRFRPWRDETDLTNGYKSHQVRCEAEKGCLWTLADCLRTLLDWC